MDFGLFFGRFHPLIVHLPIGIILVALILEWWGKASKPTLQRLWFIGAATAILAAFIGWLLAGNGSYAPSTLRWHKWLGFATCAITLMIWATYKYDTQNTGWIPKVLRIGVIALLTFGGHKGGSLTHGDGYLVEGAPVFVQKLAGYYPPALMKISDMHPDSIETYPHLVYPILQQKCESCHNPNAMNGGFDLSTLEGMQKGGDSGKVIEPGDAMDSELFKRVVLAQSEIKFMPPKGIPLTFHETEILKSWIESGANYQSKATSTKLSPSIIDAAMAVHHVDLSERPWYMKEDVVAADSSIIQSLIEKGYQIDPFSLESNYLKVVLPRRGNYNSLDLEGIKDNVIVLEAKQSNFAIQAIGELGEFNNLMRLDLSNSGVDMTSVSSLPPSIFHLMSPINRLETINLFGTNANDVSLMDLVDFPALKRVYVWQTGITEKGIEAFKSKNSGVEVITGN